MPTKAEGTVVPLRGKMCHCPTKCFLSSHDAPSGDFILPSRKEGLKSEICSVVVFLTIEENF